MASINSVKGEHYFRQFVSRETLTVDIREERAKRLKAAMKAAGVSNIDLATVVGVDAVTVSQWRTGKQWPLDRTLDQVADALGTTAAVLQYGVAGSEIGKAMGVKRPVVVREASLHNPTPTVEYTAGPRSLKRMYPAVREYLAELRLRLTRAEVSEEEIEEALELLTSPQLFRYFKDGEMLEYSEADALDGVTSIANDVIIPRLRKLGRKIP